jgi:hypothetical protein
MSFPKSNTPFIQNWNHVADNNFLEKISFHFSQSECPTLGDLSFSEYSKGIKSETRIDENGLYIFKFKESFYVGKATSCTLIERLAKHFDSRKSGGFNGLLKKLYHTDNSLDNFPINQEILMNCKLLLIPINTSLFINKNINCRKDNCIDDLEMDLIIKLRELFSSSEKNSKKKSILSGNYFK